MSHYAEASLSQQFDGFLWFDETTAVYRSTAKAGSRIPIPSDCKLASKSFGPWRHFARDHHRAKFPFKKERPLTVNRSSSVSPPATKALKMGLELGQLPFEILRDPHEIAGFLDAPDRLVENIDLRVHAGSLRSDGTPLRQISFPDLIMRVRKAPDFIG